MGIWVAAYVTQMLRQQGGQQQVSRFCMTEMYLQVRAGVQSLGAQSTSDN